MENKYKGIILAGGKGTRLHPATISISKQLLPIYDKPMIYYSLSTLMLAGIREILIISDPINLPSYQSLLSDGKRFGISLQYAEQSEPRGIAEAFIIGQEFIESSDVALILGDNLFYGEGFSKKLLDAQNNNSGGILFGHRVPDPQRFGVLEIDKEGKITKIQEKPITPNSDIAVTGLYFYKNDVIKKSKTLTPSTRGELEITDLNNLYLKEGRLSYTLLGRGFNWLDSGTPDSLLDASNLVRAIEKNNGFKIGCPEEIAFKNQWISKKELKKMSADFSDSIYYNYVLNKLT